ncbi:hypothetical protein CFC21_013380 [Triticum aestivum]|uniref:Zinc finger GRF-type domain-containing protein n=2 Tax=Triticum aestivum TaxID=4565 RepID=A0A9R1DS33_WHEAT|nr:hypothetical protein CFC21_013380 [Triticum aestivum]
MSGTGSSSGAIAGWLPLIQCPDCKIRQIRRFESTTEKHPGWILYKCMNHKVGKKPCNFWRWEASYIDYLKVNGHLRGESVDSKLVEMKKKKNTTEVDPEDMMKMLLLLKSLPGDVTDLVAVMKIAVVLLFAILFVLVLVLVRM